MQLSNAPEEVAERHWRIGLPIACLIGACLALGLARVKPRQGRFAKVVPGMITMLVYILLLLVNRNALAEATLPGVVGFWMVHGLFVVIAAILLQRLGLPVKA